MARRGQLTLRREDGRIVAESVRVAHTLPRRMRGLLGKSGLEPGEGIVLRPAWSIHTFFMRFPIDVVFLDENQTVVRIDESLRPWHTASQRGAMEVVELKAGECARRELEVGDRVAWASKADEPQAEAVRDGLASLTAPAGTVLVASRDTRFAKLARFLLESHDVGVAGVVPPERLLDHISTSEADAVVLDAHDHVADALRTAGSAAALRPDLTIVIVGESEAAARAPASARVYDKWSDTEAVVDAVVQASARAART